MTNTHKGEMDAPKLLFPSYSERDLIEAEMKGHCGPLVVCLPSTKQFEVNFYDPATLAQNLEVGQKSGEVCIGEPGLIIIPSVTVHYMQEAVNQLYREGYFDHLSPLKQK
jgi:hypothetical protein